LSAHGLRQLRYPPSAAIRTDSGGTCLTDVRPTKYHWANVFFQIFAGLLIPPGNSKLRLRIGEAMWVLGSFGTPPEPLNQYHHAVNDSATERVNAENGTRMNCRAVRQNRTGLPSIAGNITIRAAGASWEPDEFPDSARYVRHPRARAMGGEKAGRLWAGLVRGALRLRGRRNSSFLRDTAPAYTHMLC
jgi:hypothetical protein